MKKISRWALLGAFVMALVFGAVPAAAWAAQTDSAVAQDASTAAQTDSAVAQALSELAASGDTSASTLVASGLSSSEETDAYLAGLSAEQLRYVLIEVELDESTGKPVYAVRAYAQAQIPAAEGETAADADETGIAEQSADDTPVAEESAGQDLSLRADSSLVNLLVSSWKSTAASINVTSYNLDITSLFRTYCETAADNPSLFNVRTSINYAHAPNSSVVTYVLPKYLTTTTSKLADMQSDYDKAVKEALSTLPSGASERAKAYLLHDWLCDKANYNYDAARNSTSSDDTYASSFTSYGCMVEGKGVCQSFSLALSDLYRRAGLTCKTLLVQTKGHAWNMVKVDGAWYHVDATWDGASSETSHAYLLLSDSAIRAKDTNKIHDTWDAAANMGWDSSMVANSTLYDSYDWAAYDAKSDTVDSASEAKDPEPTDVTNNTTNSSTSAEVLTMYRLYNKYTGEHFYTSSTAERDANVKLGWTYEGVGWTAPKTSATPVYRLYNPYAMGGDHHYTMSLAERNALVKAGWKAEGIGWYSDDAKGTPLYRQYNPYAVSGTHNYTTSKYENDYLATIGWRAEGIAWYGINN